MFLLVLDTSHILYVKLLASKVVKINQKSNLALRVTIFSRLREFCPLEMNYNQNLINCYLAWYNRDLGKLNLSLVVGLVLGLSRFQVMTKLPQNMLLLALKVVKSDPK